MKSLLILIALFIIISLFFRTIKTIVKIGVTLALVYVVFQFIMQYI